MDEHINAEDHRTRPRRSVVAFANIVMLLAATLIVAVVGEALFRYRFGPSGYNPPAAVWRIQEQLTTRPDYGFAWRANIRAEDQIVFNFADIEFLPLSTDANGFINHPDAESGRDVDVLGMGDSFIEHAAHYWFEIARARGLDYHSMALHRTAPPQYARIFEAHGHTVNPEWIVIGLFENDFSETTDFNRWTESGMDWFTYHSGTWAGPPVDTSLRARIFNGPLQGWNLAFRNTGAIIRGQKMSVTGPEKDEITNVVTELHRLVSQSNEIGARVIIVAIPSKATALNKPTLEAEAFDLVIDTLRMEAFRSNQSIDVIDLRRAIKEHDNPASLYYEIDGHWNRDGMELAGTLVFDHIGDAKSNR